MDKKEGSLVKNTIIIITVLVVGFVAGFYLTNKEEVNKESQINKTQSEVLVKENTPQDEEMLKEVSRVNEAEPKKIIAQDIYKTYSNQSLGFSTLINNKGVIGEKIGINPVYYEKENIKFVYTYDSNPSDNINSQIVVWQEEFGECIPDYKRTSPQDEIQKNKNNLTVKERFWNDAATGHYENLSIYTISNGRKQYCVIGHIGGTRPFDKEGEEYSKQEKINTASIEDFSNFLKVFVENFNFI